MKRLLFVFTILAAFIFINACSSGDETKTEQNEAKSINETSVVEFTWHTDWDKGMEAAKKEKKPVLVDFYADWCKWCKVMDEKTFSAPEIKRRFTAGWIAIKLDTENKEKLVTFDGKTMSHLELSRYFRITGLPSYLFIDKEGNPVHIQPGYVPKERFGLILDYIKDELYKKNVDFKEYVKSNS